MEATSSSIKPILVAIICGAFFSFTFVSDTYATRGCCSRHGGVSGCDTSSGYLRCKDGTQSPSCKCSGETTKPTKTKPTYRTTTPLPPILSTPSDEKKPATRGCCKGHGGVAGCDKKSGHQKCKDGTISPSCQC